MDAESALRAGAFLAAFGAVALWEALAPRRRGSLERGHRWPANLGLLLVDVAVLRIVAPGAAVATAVMAQSRGWGVLSALDLPAWAAILASVALLDLVIYFQHVTFHAVPTLWRLHRVHHADLDFDATTGVRFHPVEILISMMLKCAAIVAIGASPAAVIAFEVLLNAASLFNHANASLPPRVERWVRRFIVTPDMHRVHHSIEYDESSSNFGFNLPLWDRLFGTYRAQPRVAHESMTLGVDAFREPADSRLDQLLLQPLRDTPGRYPINRRQLAR
jgi:sterol desaturase/sphingolipid hydroxylase (fatty acid hydroxylase superfamily)